MIASVYKLGTLLYLLHVNMEDQSLNTVTKDFIAFANKLLAGRMEFSKKGI